MSDGVAAFVVVTVLVSGVGMAITTFTYGHDIADAIRAWRFRRLTSWEINGITLPAPDDPRWTRDQTLGNFNFRGDGIFYRETYLGAWLSYTNAVKRRFVQADRAKLAAEALKELTDG